MPVINRVAELKDEVAAWRRDFHAHPELQYDLPRTSGRVAELLRQFGVDDVITGIGRSGVVGIIKGRQTSSGKVIGLRADMDALPMPERSGVAHASRHDGKMHACGHDGHTAMLLGAAKYLAETRQFNGQVALVFQPAEEGGAGGRAMVEDGLMERFGIEEIYALHNYPGLPVGHFATRTGALLAAADFMAITITGKGGHAARPHECADPVVAGAAVVQALQTFASRNVDPLQPVVVSITTFNAGTTNNVIPQVAHLSGTIRTLDKAIGDFAEIRLQEIVSQVAAVHGCTAEVEYTRNYPPTVNHPQQTALAGKVAREVAGDDHVDMDLPPVMGGEDFSFMLEARPGAFVFIGNGDSAGLHHPAYDFNDEAIPAGISFFARLVQESMPV